MSDDRARRRRPPILPSAVAMVLALSAGPLAAQACQLARNYPTELERFAAEVFPGIVESVAEVSPDTVVFPGFQFEWTMGDLRGFAHRFQHPASTATCFPEVEPDDLCTLELMQGSADFLRDWLGGEAEQADFALRFAELVEGLRPSLVFWSLLHDPDERNPAMLDGLFTHIGFRTHDGGETRPSMPLWLQRWAPR